MHGRKLAYIVLKSFQNYFMVTKISIFYNCFFGSNVLSKQEKVIEQDVIHSILSPNTICWGYPITHPLHCALTSFEEHLAGHLTMLVLSFRSFQGGKTSLQPPPESDSCSHSIRRGQRQARTKGNAIQEGSWQISEQGNNKCLIRCTIQFRSRDRGMQLQFRQGVRLI